MTNLSLIGLFQIAYVPATTGDSRFFRGSGIIGAPGWLSRTENYNVVAKVPDSALADWQNPAALRGARAAWLAAVFDLVVARNGPKLKAAETVDPKELRAKHPGSITFPDGGVVAPGTDMSQMNFFATSMATLTPILSHLAERPVQDHTGLPGMYDFSIRMSFNSLGPAIDAAMAKAGSPDVSPPPPPPPGMDKNQAAAAADSEPAISTVVQEQLGLRIEPAKGPVEILVIDHVERPTRN